MLVCNPYFYMIYYNESYKRHTENNIVVKTENLNLEHDELPKKHPLLLKGILTFLILLINRFNYNFLIF